ncbi:MAG: PorT family protein [Candidatus Eisenbacteria bacterium]|uniref:PorT family protein n=1 Tax=Eiseniibacteriota bacterium TaxID=2212470 RepID=A0A938BMB5_UNCEI|nr:PorT family protein [Candidatus Eisenbacteria bacterium]
MRVKGAIAILMALLLVVPVMAQEKQINLGVKGGINMANLSYDPKPEEGSSSLMGLAGGMVLSFNLSPAASFDGEVLYIQKGASWDVADEECSGDTDVKLTYISISPMLRFKIHSQSLTPYFMGGGEIGLLMSAKAKASWTCQGESDDYEEDVKDSFKSIDFGISFGAGVEFPMGNSGLFVEARYAMGLTDIGEDVEESTMQDEDEGTIKTKGIYLLAGIRF